jgi:PAP2 superfamily
MPVRSVSRFTTSIVLVVFLFAGSLNAQIIPVPPPSDDPQIADLPSPQLPELPADDKPVEVEEKPLSKGIVHRLLLDQKSIWTSPLHVKTSDAKWLVPLSAATALAFKKDQQISHKFDSFPTLEKKSLKFSEIGGPLPTFGAAGAFLAVGKISGNERMTGTGFHALEALSYTQAVMHGMKLITDRKRPGDGGNGRFWTGGASFPSGHSMETWALATVIAGEYHDKPLVKFGVYGLATAVSFSRMSAQRHYASDVLVGSAIGYLIGRFVIRHHSETVN